MRKVLSFVLVLALVLGSFSMAFAATPTDVVGTPNEEAVQVLMGLGVVDGYTDGTFKPAQAVTRAEMAKLIVVALGLEDYAVGVSKFSDMAGATWAQGYVNYAAGLGVILGYPDGSFKPSQTVSYDEAAAMLVRALGYTDGSLLPATWPANYVVKAKSLGILNDVAALAGGANRGDIAQMLYNTLDNTMVNVDVDSKITANTDTMLLRLGAELVPAAVIEGDEASVINLRPFIGAYAKTYINTDDEIISVVDPSSTLLTGKFKATYGTFTVDTVDYTLTAAAQADINGIVASTSAIEFYNGATVGATPTTTSTTISYTLAVDLSSKTIKEVYSVSKWVKQVGFLFDTDMTAEIADDLTISGYAFDQNDNNDIDLNSFDLLGVANLAALKADNVVYVYTTSSTALITKIEVGTATVTGKVTKVSSDGLDYTINGTVYSEASSNPTIAIGDTGTARLDYSGDLFDWTKTSSTTGNYALVSTVAAAGIDNARIKMITKDGVTATYSIDSDVTVPTLVKGDLVNYAFDATGVIDELNLLVRTSTVGGIVSASGSVVGGKQLTSDTVIFTSDNLSTMAATATVFDVATKADIAGETLTTAYYYDAATQDGILEVIIVASTFTGSASNYAVINATSSALNADDTAVVFVEGFKDGVAFSAYTDKIGTNATLAFDAAKLYDLTINSSGVVTAITPVTAEITNAEVTSVSAVVYAKDGNLLQMTSATGTWYTVDPSVVVYQLDVSDEEYTLKTMASITKDTNVKMWQVNNDSEKYDVIIITRP